MEVVHTFSRCEFVDCFVSEQIRGVCEPVIASCGEQMSQGRRQPACFPPRPRFDGQFGWREYQETPTPPPDMKGRIAGQRSVVRSDGGVVKGVMFNNRLM